MARGPHLDDVYRYALAVSGNSLDAMDVTVTTMAEASWSPRRRLTDIAHEICRSRYEWSGGIDETPTLCPEQELAISRQFDGRLGRAGRRAVLAHLPTCGSCAAFADDVQRQRAALKELAEIPVPATLEWLKSSRARLPAARHLHQ